MKKHTALVFVLIILIGFLAFWVFGTNKAAAPEESDSATKTQTTQTKQDSTSTTPNSADTDCPETASPVLAYENGSFSPECITVVSGTTVTWKNNSKETVELGANQHPGHSGNKELTNGAYTLEIPAGGQVTSTLKTAGTHTYHNHLNEDAAGRIVVR